MENRDDDFEKCLEEGTGDGNSFVEVTDWDMMKYCKFSSGAASTFTNLSNHEIIMKLHYRLGKLEASFASPSGSCQSGRPCNIPTGSE